MDAKENVRRRYAALPAWKKAAAVLPAALGCLAILSVIPPMFKGIFHMGTAIGLLGGGMYVAAALLLPLCTVSQKKPIRVLYRIYLAVVAALTAFCLVISVTMAAAMADAPEQGGGRTAIVLGCQVYDSGPSVMMINRLDAARRYLEDEPSAVCVVSGGKGEGEPVTEALAMKEYLISHGIAQERIFVEDGSRNTVENLEFSKRIIEENGLCPKVAIITDGFHQKRARMIAENLGMDARSVCSATPLYLLPSYWFREWAGIAFESLSRLF